MSDFSGFTASMFAAYTQDKWASNVHNLTRMRVKESLIAMCDRAQAMVGDDDFRGLGRSASDEIPNITNHKKVDAQWVYWIRGAEARSRLATFLNKTQLSREAIFDLAPQDKHAALTVVLREREVWVGLRVAPQATVDRRNLASRLSKSWDRETLLGLLVELPEGACLGSAAGQAQPTVSISSLQLEEMGSALGANAAAWTLGHTIAAEDAIALEQEICDYVGRWLGALLPFYRFVAWTGDNDHIEANKQLQEEKEKKRKNSTNYNPGDKVRVTTGLFLGKLGEVIAVDTKGQVRVRIGKVAVVLPGTGLVLAT